MIKIICDRCGKELLTTYSQNTRKVVFLEGSRTEYDLCKNCMVEVRNFVVEPAISVTLPDHCLHCENVLSSECTACDGYEYFKEDTTDCVK